jgi:serine/threonine-protein kinase SRK2
VAQVCDFGYSKAVHPGGARSKVGTLAYMAPEVLTVEDRAPYCAKLVDVWSLGVRHAPAACLPG